MKYDTRLGGSRAHRLVTTVQDNCWNDCHQRNQNYKGNRQEEGTIRATFTIDAHFALKSIVVRVFVGLDHV